MGRPILGSSAGGAGVASDPHASFARVRAGRLVEIHVRALADVQDVTALHAEVVEAIRRAGPRTVICADHRFASPLSPDVADAWARAMRQNNAAVALAGLLIDPTNAMYNLQLDRVVRCAGSSTRRVFVELEDLRTWVGAALTGAERDALSQLFARAPRPDTASR